MEAVMRLTKISLEAPYLLYLGDCPDMLHAKTAAGIAHWRPDRCAGQMRLPDCPVDLKLPELTVQGARDAGIKTVVVGVAPMGGRMPGQWLEQLTALAAAGFDIAAGLHTKLVDIPELVAAASKGKAKLIDVRVPPADLPVGDGRLRSGKRVLTVGTDCAVGKK